MAFKSRSNSYGVTVTSELQTAARAFLGGAGAHTIRVNDTPGEVLEGSYSVVGEIARCADLARDGIHGILVVLTARARFSVEELAAIGILQDLFGEKMVDYMIVVFTGGDDREANDESLEDYLGQNCPHALKELLHYKREPTYFVSPAYHQRLMMRRNIPSHHRLKSEHCFNLREAGETE